MDRAEIGGKAGHDFRLGRGPCARIAAGFLLPKTTLAQAADACVACHTANMPGTVKQGEDSYFVEFEKVVSDDNMPWEKTDALLRTAYPEGLLGKDNPLDETPEIMH